MYTLFKVNSVYGYVCLRDTEFKFKHSPIYNFLIALLTRSVLKAFPFVSYIE